MNNLRIIEQIEGRDLGLERAERFTRGVVAPLLYNPTVGGIDTVEEGMRDVEGDPNRAVNSISIPEGASSRQRRVLRQRYLAILRNLINLAQIQSQRDIAAGRRPFTLIIDLTDGHGPSARKLAEELRPHLSEHIVLRI